MTGYTDIQSLPTDFLIQNEPAPGTVSHTEWLSELTRRDRVAWEKGQGSLFAVSVGNSADQHHVQMRPQGPISSSDRSYRGSMAHGEGIVAPDGLIDVGGVRTDPATAEMLRLNSTPQEWTALTGLAYEPVVKGKAPEQRGSEAVSNAQRDAVAEQRQKEAEALKADAMLDPENVETQVVEPSLLEQVVTQHWDQDVADRVKGELLKNPELTEEHRSKLGISESMFEDVVQHYVETADRVLAPVNSSSALMAEMLNDKEQETARKALVNADITTVRRLGAMAAERFASMTGSEIADFLSPKEKEVLKLRVTDNDVPVVEIQGQQMAWATAVGMRLIAL